MARVADYRPADDGETPRRVHTSPPVALRRNTLGRNPERQRDMLAAIAALPIIGGTMPNDKITFSQLLQKLNFAPNEFVSICHRVGDGRFATSVCAVTDAQAKIQKLPAEADVYFGVNPTKGPARASKGRGKDSDITRLSALIADLDIAIGKCADTETAHAIIDELSEILTTRPTAITYSGGGLHPYWPVLKSDDDASVFDVDRVRSLLARWKRLVKMIAAKHGANVDSVFDAARVLRVPGTCNQKKTAGGSGPVRVDCRLSGGVALTLAEIEKRIDAYGIHDIAEYPDDSAKLKSDPQSWVFADETCSYVAAMVGGWADPANVEIGKGRHQWLLSQSVRMHCAHRLGCISSADFDHAKNVAEQTFRLLRQTRDPVGSVTFGEVADAWEFGRLSAATKTKIEARTELGDHAHDANTTVAGAPHWPGNDNYAKCAERVFAECADAGKPLRQFRNQWYQFDPAHGYSVLDERDLRAMLRRLTQDATYVGSSGDALQWKPDSRRLRELASAMEDSETATLPRNFAPPEKIDGPPLDSSETYIPVRNGVLRLSDRALLDHDPNLFAPNGLPITYDPSATAPHFQSYLDSSFPGEQRQKLALQFLGFYVSGRKHPQKMLILTGPTRSGKGTFVYVIEQLLGSDKLKALTPKSLEYTFGREGLENAMVGVFEDIRQLSAEDKRRMVEFILNVVGDDSISFARKNKPEYNGRIAARLIYTGNAWPPLDDNANALAARFEFLDSPNSFTDSRMDYRPHLRNETAGIFNMALDGLDSLLKDGRFVQVDSSQDAREAAQVGGPMAEFVNERCAVGETDDYFVVGDVFRSELRVWASEHGYSRHQDFMSDRNIFNALQMVMMQKPTSRFRGGQKRIGQDKKPVRGYFGLRLKMHRRMVAGGLGG